MNEKPNYYSILPASVRYDEELRMGEKLLYSEITALSNKYGYCMASNAYFAKLYKVEPRSIRRWISNLTDRGFLRAEIDRDEDTNQVVERRLYIVETPGDRNVPTPPDTIVPTPGDRNVLYNTTSINTTSINSIYSQAEPDDTVFNDQVNEIISYLNTKTGKGFKNSAYAKRHIRARMNDGFSVDDFKQVIDKKVSDWKDNKEYEKYLRPQTLFGTKFESYLNEGSSNDYDFKKFSEGLGW